MIVRRARKLRQNGRRKTSAIGCEMWKGDETEEVLARCGFSNPSATRIRENRVGFAPQGEGMTNSHRIEISDEFIAISTMPVDPMTASRISNVLWPAPLMKSSWSFAKVLVAENIKAAAYVLGIQVGSPPTTIEQVLARHAELTRLPPTKKDSKGGPSPLPPLTQTPGRMSIPTQPEVKASEAKKTDSKEVSIPLQAHLTKPLLAFKTEFQKNWKPARNFPPRGSILVTGFVEVDSPRAWLVFDVKAAWDPKTKTFDLMSMVLSLRRLQMKKQGPLGGL